VTDIRRNLMASAALLALAASASVARAQVATAYPLGAADHFFGQTIALDDSAGRLSVHLLTAAYVTLLRIQPGVSVEPLAASEPLPAGLVSVAVPAQQLEVRPSERVSSSVPSAQPARSEADVAQCVRREMSFWRAAATPRPGLLIDGTRPVAPSPADLERGCGGAARTGASRTTTVTRAQVVRAVSDYLLVVVSEAPLNDTALAAAMRSRRDLTVAAVDEELGRLAGEQGPAWAAWLIRR
jgi:hypothetical protein